MKGAVALARVDNRLVHGQVLEAWVPALQATAVLVADDEASQNLLARAAMALAIPPRVSLQVLSVAQAASLLRGDGPPSARTLLLVRDVRDAATLAAAGVELPKLNLGNVHFRTGRKAVAPSVYLDEDELRVLDELAAKGTAVDARAVPSDPPVSLPALHQHFAQA